jgi:hypothetical protein
MGFAKLKRSSPLSPLSPPRQLAIDLHDDKPHNILVRFRLDLVDHGYARTILLYLLQVAGFQFFLSNDVLWCAGAPRLCPAFMPKRADVSNVLRTLKFHSESEIQQLLLYA